MITTTRLVLVYLAGVATPFLCVVSYMIITEIVGLWRSAVKYGGESESILNPLGRVIQRIIQAVLRLPRKP